MHILELMNNSAQSYNNVIKSEVDEQKKRDAFMVQSGQVTMAVSILSILERRSKNGKPRIGQSKTSSGK